MGIDSGHPTFLFRQYMCKIIRNQASPKSEHLSVTAFLAEFESHRLTLPWIQNTAISLQNGRIGKVLQLANRIFVPQQLQYRMQLLHLSYLASTAIETKIATEAEF